MAAFATFRPIDQLGSLASFTQGRRANYKGRLTAAFAAVSGNTSYAALTRTFGALPRTPTAFPENLRRFVVMSILDFQSNNRRQ